MRDTQPFRNGHAYRNRDIGSRQAHNMLPRYRHFLTVSKRYCGRQSARQPDRPDLCQNRPGRPGEVRVPLQQHRRC